MKKKLFFMFTVFALIAASGFVFTGCNNVGGNGTTGPSLLYLLDTYNGRVYTYDFATQTASSTPLVTIGQNASGKIYFFNDIGYVAVGADGGNTPGVYYFDPNADFPVATRIGNTISAQYIAFYSDTKAYVTDANWGISTGVYTFDPSNPDAGLSEPITGTTKTKLSSMYLQDIVVGLDGRVYVADNNDDGGNGQVLQIDPATDTVTKTYDMTKAGTTGLLAGSGADGIPVIYAANSGGYEGLNPLPGSIDSINSSSGVVSTVVEDISTTSIAYDSGTDSYYAVGVGNTYVIAANGSPPWSATEIKDADNVSFGGGDVVIHSGLVYIPDYDWSTNISKLYVIDTSSAAVTDYSPVSIMVDGEDGAVAAAVYYP